MKNLIRADLFRLSKDKLFYSFIAITVLLPTALNCLFYFGYDLMVAHSPNPEDIETILAVIKAFPMSMYAFEITNSAGLLAVLSIALYVGRDYMNGTIRNKIIAGHSRAAVYLSSLIVSTISALVIISAFIISMLALGIPMQGWGANEALAVCLRQYAVGFLITLASAAVANMVAVLSRGIIASLLVNLGVIFGLTGIISVLTLIWDKSSMPAVASFFMKTVYMGQLSFLYSDFSIGFFITTLVSTMAMIFVISVMGIATFKKLDLN